jgi:hypothetical protein
MYKLFSELVLLVFDVGFLFFSFLLSGFSVFY